LPSGDHSCRPLNIPRPNQRRQGMSPLRTTCGANWPVKEKSAGQAGAGRLLSPVRAAPGPADRNIRRSERREFGAWFLGDDVFGFSFGEASFRRGERFNTANSGAWMLNSAVVAASGSMTMSAPRRRSARRIAGAAASTLLAARGREGFWLDCWCTAPKFIRNGQTTRIRTALSFHAAPSRGPRRRGSS